jgi:hypothetical protein
MPRQFRSPYGAPKYADGVAVAASVATLAALKALDDVGDLVHGNEMLVDADGSVWYFHSTSALTGDNVLVATPDATAYASAGRWLRKPGRVSLKLAITYATANNAALLTLPTGSAFALDRAFWHVTTGFTGGSSSAIGVSSTTRSTAGDILGGASGDVAATLVAGYKAGTVGTTMDTDVELHANLFSAGEVFSFNRITSAFTAGAGYVVLVGDLVANPGA